MDNPILDTDSYKSSHWLQYPPGTTKLVAYLESRGGAFDTTLFFGLQYLVKKYLTPRITEQHVREADAFFRHHQLPFNLDGWLYVVTNLKGRIPLKIDAAPEGSIVPTSNILMRVESTDERCFWMTTWFETMLLRVWYPTTVATLSWHAKQIIFKYLENTADNPLSEISFKLHDFGARGVSSQESASIGGASHLVNFSGSDTISGMLFANTYYNAHLTPSSIPAAEHSCIITWGKDHEDDAYSHILSQLSKQSPIIALPADSYSTEHAVDTVWGETLRNEVKKSNTVLVVRTDSGDPPSIVLKTLQSLEKSYGSSHNSKGYKVLSNIRVLHSDQISLQMIRKILRSITDAKYSATNLVFGMGGALLQDMNRDTLQFAYKVCEITTSGNAHPVKKSPVDAPGKESKGGYLDLLYENGTYKTTHEKQKNSALVPIFMNGELLQEYSFDEIRNRAWSG